MHELILRTIKAPTLTGSGSSVNPFIAQTMWLWSALVPHLTLRPLRHLLFLMGLAVSEFPVRQSETDTEHREYENADRKQHGIAHLEPTRAAKLASLK